MFDLSVEKLLILAVVALFVLGPERLPTAAAWLARTLRQIKTYATDANQKIHSELGPEFDDIRTPLNELRSDLAGLRTWRDPRAALLHHLRDDPTTPHRYPPPPGEWEPTPNQQPASPPPQPLAAGERPPIDPDTT
ncbi:MAG TPA: twin-arginine translocase TatA/TatE family subunit [Pseudonocardiaceae bacterium]|nr:twin-arginine translocase TatA/TatE family subunit [Pseudonocardiaceae bacterium]